jgi:hypothetical protein
MNNEFKKISKDDVTRYVLESASGGGTSAGNVASVSKAMGGVQSRSNLLVQDVSPKLTPRSPVAHAAQKVAKGSGKHTDRKQQSRQVRGEKHKTKDFAENQDHEISMAGSELHSIFQNAKQLHSMIKTKSEEEGLDAWQQSKITKAADYLNSVLQSLQHEIMGEGDRTMSRAAKGMMKYGKDGMRALAKAGREGASEKQLDTIRDKHDHYNEGWSQKYKNSINCSHPKGFSQRAHCAGKRKHNESIEMEMTCPDCGMCRTHGNNMMEVKQRLDAKCWKGKHKEGTKIKGGVRVNNCVPNEGVAEGDELDTDWMNDQGQDFYYKNPSFNDSDKEITSLDKNKLATRVSPTGGVPKVKKKPITSFNSSGSDKELVSVIKAGPGFNVVKTADGETHRRTGTRPWRNNNPGNISFDSGGYAKSQGAIGTDGRYAIFPTPADGMAACKNLLFGTGSKYSKLTIQATINRYAPSHENDTERYIRDVTKATGTTPDTILKDLTDSQRDVLLKTIYRVEGFYTKGKIEVVSGKKSSDSGTDDLDVSESQLAELDRPSGKLFIIVKADNAGATHVFGDFGSFPQDVMHKVSKRGTRDKSGAKTKLKIDFLFDDFRSTIQQLRTIFRDVDFVGAEAAEFIIHSSALRSDQGEDVKHLRDYIEAGDDRRMTMYQAPEDDEEDDGETTGGSMLRIDPETGAARKVVGVKPQTQMGGKSVEQPGMTTYRFKNPVFAQKLRGMNLGFNIKGDTITVDQKQKDDLVSMLGNKFSDIFTSQERFKEENIELSEKAVSQQQQKFFGMVHAMQKGKKIPGASAELKKTAKSMSKGDAKDFAKTRHAGLPKKVSEKMELPPTGMNPEDAQKFAADQMAKQQALYKQPSAGKIDYTKDGPITQSSLGHKLEYGIPVNDKGEFLNPNRLPNIHELPRDEEEAMSAAYKTWLADYLKRWPNATQRPDGSMQGIKPGLAPMNLKPPANEDTYVESLSAALEQKLSVNDTPEVWRDDFEHADPVKYPQFKNKTVEKKHRMADVARYRQIQKK